MMQTCSQNDNHKEYYYMNIIPSSREEALRLAQMQPPHQFMKTIRPTSFGDVISSLTPRLEELPDERAKAFLAAILNQAISCLATQERMNAQGVEHAAELILQDYRHLTLCDLALCISMGLRGQLEEFYGRFDVQVAYSWFYHYNILRTQAMRLAEMRTEEI